VIKPTSLTITSNYYQLINSVWWFVNGRVRIVVFTLKPSSIMFCLGKFFEYQ